MYQEVSRILTEAYKKTASVKSLCLTSKWKNKKQLYALVLETLKYRSVIDSILETTKLLEMERKLRNDRNLARAMVYDLVFGKGGETVQRDKKTPLTGHKNSLNAALVRMKIQAGVCRNDDLLPESVKRAGQTLPRYVRVNTITSCTDDVIKHFQRKGYELISSGTDERCFLSSVKDLSGKKFMKDYHVLDLLVFAPGTDLHNDDMYKNGSIVLQDKASCLPAYLLNPPPGSLVLDCCAAPGNKTTHAAALMGNRGRIFAFDLDEGRADTLRSLSEKVGASCVQVVHGDFLKVRHDDPRYRDAEYVLVDPSCSGSGIASRLNALTDDTDSVSEERLERLSRFQISIICHALSFRNVKRLTYSTCSIHSRENEHVVQAVLARFNDVELVSVLPTWSHRGSNEYDFGRKCLRAGPEDLTNGFFVAVFQKKNYVVCSSICVGESSISVRNEKKKRKRKRKLQSICQEAPIVVNESETTISPDLATVSESKSARKRKRKREKMNDMMNNGKSTIKKLIKEQDAELMTVESARNTTCEAKTATSVLANASSTSPVANNRKKKRKKSVKMSQCSE